MTQPPTQQQTPQAQTTGQASSIPVQQGGAQQSQYQGQRQPMGTTQLTQQQRGIGLRFAEGVPQETQAVINSFVESIKLCEWCADQCLDEGPEMAECVRLCRDVEELGSVTVKLLSRNSPFAYDVASQFMTVAQACAHECSRHEHAHCQDCAQQLDNALMTAQQLFTTEHSQQTGRL